MVRGGNSLTDIFLKRCVYGDCQTQFKEFGRRKYCELHQQVRALEQSKEGILKKQMKRANEPLIEIQCKYCGKTALSISGAKKFCSSNCKSKHHRIGVRITRIESQIVKYQKELVMLRAKL